CHRLRLSCASRRQHVIDRRPNEEATMIHTTTSLSRRRLLQAGSATLAAGLSAFPAFAKAPMLGTQAPYFYRFKVGSAECTVVSDGVLPLGDPTQDFLGVTQE